jgi:methylaspartate mutase epsilon subunit
MTVETFFQPEVSNACWSDAEFEARRRAVLARWRTGDELTSLDECVARSAAMPDRRNFPRRLREAHRDGVPLFQVGIGHTTIPEQIDHMRAAEQEGVDLILVLTDTYTRKSIYEKAESAIERALRVPGSKLLNGFPVVNYGRQSEAVFSSVDIPVHISGNVDEEAMLSSEMGYATGATCDFSHSIHDLVQHSRDYPLSKRLQANQYVSRLAAYYTERGAPIELLTLANYQGLIPPGLGIAVAVLSLLSSAEQGARYFSLHRCIEGCLTQDVAAFAAYRRVADHFVARFGYDVDCVTHAWPWMGGWPENEHEAAALVSWCTSIALLANVDWIYLKSIHEGSGIPNSEANVASIRIARELRRIVPTQSGLTNPAIEEETEMIFNEACAIIDAALDMGDGDATLGQLRAVQRGAIDIPISAWNGVNDSVVAIRDADGAVRYLNSGKLPLPSDVKAYHARRVAERKSATSVRDDITLVVQDIRRYMAG